MTYSEKLKTSQWLSFRAGFIGREQDRYGMTDSPPSCYSCGEQRGLQVHHRRYIDGLEPWEYEDEDLILICDPCHGRVHEAAKAFHDWILSIPPDRAYEVRYLLDELRRLPDPGVALARCKTTVREIACAWESLRNGGRQPRLINGEDVLDEFMAEMAEVGI